MAVTSWYMVINDFCQQYQESMQTRSWVFWQAARASGFPVQKFRNSPLTSFPQRKITSWFGIELGCPPFPFIGWLGGPSTPTAYPRCFALPTPRPQSRRAWRCRIWYMHFDHSVCMLAIWAQYKHVLWSYCNQVHAWTLIIVHACTMIIVRACTKVIIHARTMISTCMY